MSRLDDNREPLSPEAAELLGLAGKSIGQLTPAQHARGLAGLRARRAHDLRQRARARLAFGVLGAAAVAAGAWIAVPHLFEAAPSLSAPIGYQVLRGAIEEDGTIRPPTPDAEPALKFSDGTVIELGRGTVGRLAKVDGRGARVSIANGTARVNVVPKPRAHWLIDAGPFLITVHGTVFTAAWNDAEARLEVRLSHGLISVSGPVASGPVAVRAGQRLTISLRDSRVVLRKLDDDSESDVLEGTTVEAALGPPGRGAEPAPHRPARSLRGGRAWAAALSAGDFDAVLADAEKDLGRALATRSSDDLAALADAARYRRHDDVARRALHAQRRRFPGSARAADAAFFLGRLEENTGGRGLGQALSWYDRYLDEAPSGSYAAEALGRKMVAVREVQGIDAAREIAAEYVRRFPRGTYAGTARAIRVER